MSMQITNIVYEVAVRCLSLFIPASKAICNGTYSSCVPHVPDIEGSENIDNVTTSGTSDMTMPCVIKERERGEAGGVASGVRHDGT